MAKPWRKAPRGGFRTEIPPAAAESVKTFLGNQGRRLFQKGLEALKPHATRFMQTVSDRLTTGDFFKFPGRGKQPTKQPTGVKPLPDRGFQITGTPGKATETFYTSSFEGKHEVPDFVKKSQKIEFVTDNSVSINTSAGLQATGDLVQLSTSILNSYNSAIFGGNATNTTSTGTGSLYTIANMVLGSSSASTSQTFFASCDAKYTLTNLSNSIVQFDFYELCAKHDLGVPSVFVSTPTYVYSPYEMWSYGLQISSAVATPPTALATNAFSTSGLLTPLNLGSVPTDSQTFNTYWKIMSQYTVNMGIGDVHVHNSKYHLNQFISDQRFINSALLGGITRTVMVTVRGMPGIDTTTGSAITTAAKVIMKCEMNYKAYSVPYSRTSTFYASTIAAGATDVIKSVNTDTPTESIATTYS